MSSLALGLPDLTAEILGMPRLTAAAFMEALIIEKAYKEAAEETGGTWPVGCCVEASLDLREVLETTLPEVGAEYVWGQFVINGMRHPIGHAWVALADGTIIDMTAGQFLPDQPADSTLVVLPNDPLHEHYVETEREPHWARTYESPPWTKRGRER